MELWVVDEIQGGNNVKKILNLKEDTIKKTSINLIKNSDNLCGVRAIVVGLSYFLKPENNFDTEILKQIGIYNSEGFLINTIKTIRDCRKTIQSTLSQDLIKYCNLTVPVGGLTTKEFQIISQKLNIQINIIAGKTGGGYECIYSGTDQKIKLFLLYHDNHYDNINSITGFYCSSYYCDKCHTPYQNKNKHVCKNDSKCLLCYGSENNCKSGNDET